MKRLLQKCPIPAIVPWSKVPDLGSCQQDEDPRCNICSILLLSPRSASPVAPSVPPRRRDLGFEAMLNEGMENAMEGIFVLRHLLCALSAMASNRWVVGKEEELSISLMSKL